MRKIPQPVLYKTTFQLRFPGNLRIANRLSDAAGELDGFVSWKISPGRVICQDFDNHNSLTVEIGAITSDMDLSDSDSEARRIAQVVEAAKYLGLDSFGRFGFRKRYLTDLDSTEMEYADLVKIFDLKFNSQDETLKSWLPPIVDSLFRIDSEDEDGLRYKIQFAPIKPEQIHAFLEVNEDLHFNPETKTDDLHDFMKKYPKVGLFTDIDVAMFSKDNKLNIEEVENFEKVARQKLEEMSKNFSSYLFG